MTVTTYKKLMVTRLSRNFREAVEIVEVPFPTPGADEIVMRNIYAGINASDVNYSAGVYDRTVSPPFDAGFESIGEVVAVGASVTALKPGDAAAAISNGGGFREYAVHPAKRVFPVDEPRPEYLSMMVSGLTASFGLYLAGEMRTDETVMVTAAAGGTGQYAVQLAKIAGNHVIGTCSSDEKADMLREFGCDRVINYRDEDVRTVLKNEYPTGLDLVYESVGGEMFDTCLRNLAIRGRLVIIGYISEYSTDRLENITAPRIYGYLLGKSASVRGMFLNHYLRHAPEHLMKLIELYRSGQLNIKIDPISYVGIDSIVDAVEHLHSGKSQGKVMVRL